MKKEILRFWNNHASQYMWLHNKSETKYKMMDKVILLLNMIITSILGFYLIFDNKAISVGCFFSVMLSYNSLKNNYKTKSIYHNIAKKEYRLFLEDINQVDLNNELILFKKFELNRLINNSPNIPQQILDKYNRKFFFFPLISNFTKISKKYNLYDKIILIKAFTRWSKIIFKKKYNAYSLGPFYGGRKFLFQFQNVKLNNNNIEISIE